MKTSQLITLLPLLVASSNMAELKAQETTKPKPANVILILVDDQGWNALSTRMDSADKGSGSTYYQTPHIDQLAKRGAKFSYAYSAAPTSGPSRHCIQFGRSATAMNLFAESHTKSLRLTESESLANIIKKNAADYQTAHFGKWHITRKTKALGYDISDGDTSNANGQSKDPLDPKKTFSLTTKAKRFISEQVKAQKPFFLQISYYANHLKYQALDSTIQEFNKRSNQQTPYHNSALWAAMNKDLDTGIGQVLTQLQELHITDNTYIILTADNGYECKLDNGKAVKDRGYYQAHPLLSHKYMINEGGIRVPFILAGPGIKGGMESQVPIIGYDIYPTVLDIIGIKDKTPETVEGGSILPLVQGKSHQIKRKNDFFVFRYTKSKGALDVAIIEGNYKLLKEITSNTLHLWDIKKDQGEKHNLITEKPELAARLYEKMSQYFKQHDWDESQAGAEATKQNKTKQKKGKKKANKPSKNIDTKA